MLFPATGTCVTTVACPQPGFKFVPAMFVYKSLNTDITFAAGHGGTGAAVEGEVGIADGGVGCEDGLREDGGPQRGDREGDCRKVESHWM